MCVCVYLTHTFVLITNSDKKHRHSNGARSGQTGIPFGHIRRTGNNSTTTGLLPDGNKVIITFPIQEQDSRLVDIEFKTYIIMLL